MTKKETFSIRNGISSKIFSIQKIYAPDCILSRVTGYKRRNIHLLQEVTNATQRLPTHPTYPYRRRCTRFHQ